MNESFSGNWGDLIQQNPKRGPPPKIQIIFVANKRIRMLQPTSIISKNYNLNMK